MTSRDLVTNQNLPQGSKDDLRAMAPESGVELLPSGRPRIGPAPAAAPAEAPLPELGELDLLSSRQPSMPQFTPAPRDPLGDLEAQAAASGNHYLMAVLRRARQA